MCVGNIDGGTDWSAALDGVDAVVHLAAKVHVMDRREARRIDAFRETNVVGTRNLVRAAVSSGARRLVFLSTIKVNGEEIAGRTYAAEDPPDPKEPYAISKTEAERVVRQAGESSPLETVIIRPPLVFGPEVKGNFLRLLRAVYHGVPLPFGLVDNRRSLVGVDNLVEFILLCCRHPAAIGETFLICDSPPISTRELVRRLAASFERRPRLLPVPARLLGVASRVPRLAGLHQRLCGSLLMDAAPAAAKLGWRQPYSMDHQLERVARWFEASR